MTKLIAFTALLIIGTTASLFSQKKSTQGEDLQAMMKERSEILKRELDAVRADSTLTEGQKAHQIKLKRRAFKSSLSKGKQKKEKRFTDEESIEIKAALEKIHQDPKLSHSEKIMKRKEYLSEYTRKIREGKYSKERKPKPTDQDKQRINEEAKSAAEAYKNKGEYARDQRNKTSYKNSFRANKNKEAILDRLIKREKTAIKEYKQGKITEEQYLHYMDKITNLREELEYRY